MKRMKNPVGIPGVLMLIQNPKKRVKHRNPQDNTLIWVVILAGVGVAGYFLLPKLIYLWEEVTNQR